MLFYPVIFTRTGHPNGRDYQYWAKLPHVESEFYRYTFGKIEKSKTRKYHELEDQIDKILSQTINEDMLPNMTRPRRMFFREKDREKDFVYWGLALHNDDFVPKETLSDYAINGINAESAHFRNVRGFWGGFVDLENKKVHERERDELADLIASSLICTSTDLMLDQEVQNASDPRRPKQFFGKSPFPFAARMFQHFVMRWWNSNLSVSHEPYYENAPDSQPFLSTSPYDLSCFISPVSTVKFKESPQTEDYLEAMKKHREKKEKDICAYVEDDDIVEKDLIRLIKSREEELHLGPVEIVSHARIIKEEIPEANVVFINEAERFHNGDERFHTLSKKMKKMQSKKTKKKQ